MMAEAIPKTTNPPLEWEMCKEAFEWDGSLRDIYVLGTDLGDWEKFLAFLKASPYTLEFTVNGSAESLPDFAAQLFASRDENTYSLCIDPSGMNLRCHFFWSKDIELDVDPRDISGQDQLNRLLDFLRRIGQLLSKPVILTPENSEKYPLLRFDPRGKDFKHLLNTTNLST